MDVGTMAISGLIARDFDIEGVITQLAQIRRRPVALLEERKSACNDQIVALQQLTARALSLSTSASALLDGTAFGQVSASSSDESAVVVSASAGAPVGSYDIVVSKLAQSHKVSSGVVTSADEALGYAGDIIINGQVVTIEAADTLSDIRDAINGSGAGVSASILTVAEDDHRLSITSLTSGVDGAIEMIDANASGILEAIGLQDSLTTIKHAITDGAAGDALSDKFGPIADALGLVSAPAGTVQINGVDVAIDLATDSLEDIASAISAVSGVTATIQTLDLDGQAAYRLEIVGDTGVPTFVDDANVLTTLGVLEKGFANTVDAAQDAAFTIDGVAMTRSTNAVDDAIENVQLQLVSETGGSTVTVDVRADTAATVETVESFVDAYNEVIRFINKHQDFDAETEQGGLFFGSPVVMQIEAQLRDQVSDLVDTMGGDLLLASQVGLSFDAHDQLVLDSAALLDALATNPEGVRRLFGTRTDTTSPEVQVHALSSATADSGAAGYAVEITQAAERATARSDVLPSGITLDETLTIDGKSITLTAGMSLQEAADLINALATAQGMAIDASVDGDTIVVEHELYGTSHEITIESSLDDGAGGTGLGGAVAGEVEVYTGRDVAGTIGGEAAEGRGRILTAAEGSPAEGLQLIVTAETTGSKGVVLVSKGIATRLTDYLEAITDPDAGSLTRATEGVNAQIESIDEEIADLEGDVDRYIEELQAQFSRMETQMSQSLSLLDWLENQVKYLPGGWRE